MQGYFLLALSLILETGKNIVNNDFSKRTLKNNADIYKFGFFMYLCSFFSLVWIKTESPSLFTLITAMLFAGCLSANQYFFLKALRTGSMSFTNFMQGASLLIPTVYGVIIWKEPVSAIQVISIGILVFSLFWVLHAQPAKNNPLWWLYSLFAAVAMGGIGIIQSTYQMSVYKSESISFLKLSFLFTALIYFAIWLFLQRTESSFPPKSTALYQSAISGVSMAGVHVINLNLAGTLPKAVFFPVANGGVILLTLLFSVLLFRERITKLQWLGLLFGIAALCLIGIG